MKRWNFILKLILVLLFIPTAPAYSCTYYFMAIPPLYYLGYILILCFVLYFEPLMKNIALITGFVALSGAVGLLFGHHANFPMNSYLFLVLSSYFILMGFLVFKSSQEQTELEKLSIFFAAPGWLLTISFALSVLFAVFVSSVHAGMYLILFLMLIIWTSTLGLKGFIVRNSGENLQKKPFSYVFHKIIFKPVAYGFLFSLFMLLWFNQRYLVGEMFAFIPLAISVKAVWDYVALLRKEGKLPPFFPDDYIWISLQSVIAGGGIVMILLFLSRSHSGTRTPYYMSLIPAAVGMVILVKAYLNKQTGNKFLYAIKFAVVFFPFLLLLFHITGFLPLNVHQCYTGCQYNMKNIGAALEMYSKEHSGHYPKSLNALSPRYLEEVPQCITNLKPGTFAERHYINIYKLNTGEYVYTSSANPDAYTFYCAGNNHKVFGIDKNYPQYNSAEGLIPKQ